MIKVNIDGMLKRIAKLEFEETIENGSFAEVIKALRDPDTDPRVKRRLWSERIDMRIERRRSQTPGAVRYRAIMVPKGSDRAGKFDCTGDQPRRIEQVDHGRDLERIQDDDPDLLH
jgi:hypothetical protein